MKIIFSEIKKWLPTLSVDAKTLRDDLTLIGHFVSGFEEINEDVILDLEIRQNRADCLGYYGVARDLSVFYKIELSLPTVSPITYTDQKLPITVSSPDVNRLCATALTNIKNSPSPDWLINFLKLHDINSINTLVDLTNYVMLQGGIPCHAFDSAKAQKLNWENNNGQYKEFTTLDGTKLNLTDNCLLITDGKLPVSLSFIGGQNSGIQLDTTSSIIEMAIYNHSRVRTDSRSLKTITEASIRLDKQLDTKTIPLAFNHLISLITQNCQATLSGEFLDIYPNPPKEISIEFDPASPSVYAGIDISSDFTLDCLSRLGCTINNNLITPPSIRQDINLPEDLIEEVIRFYGYNKIPTDSPINNSPLPDITPPVLYQSEELKDKLVSLGYDEVRSWPLVSTVLDPNTVIKTQNSINSDYPYLRQSMIQSLQNQLKQYNRYKLPPSPFFEIGKIFSQTNGKISEQYALGTYDPILDKFDQTILDQNEKHQPYIPSAANYQPIELTSQIITLDANVNFDSPQDPTTLIATYTTKIDPQVLWSIDIIDIYQNRYTFRCCYYNCTDKVAKKIHLSAFGLD
jgi:phenylalanyl-tRNA synthetase beta chain